MQFAFLVHYEMWDTICIMFLWSKVNLENEIIASNFPASCLEVSDPSKLGVVIKMRQTFCFIYSTNYSLYYISFLW